MLKIIFLRGIVCLGLAVLPAAADPIINFDDVLAPSSSVAPLPVAYHGLNWNGLGVLDGVNFSVKPSGYQAGVVSSNNVIYPMFGNYAVGFNGGIQGGLFDLNSAYVTAALYDNLALEARGYIHGTLVYHTTNILSAVAPTKIQFNFYGVDEVDFVTSGGSVHPGYPFGFDPGFVMDNVDTTVYVPYAPLLLNGDFEAGNFSGWALSGQTNNDSVVTNAAYVHSGSYGARVGPVSSLGYLSQTVMPTFAGELYLFSFWAENPVAGTPNQFYAAWNGTSLVNITNIGAFPWSPVQFAVTPYTPRARIQIGLRNDPAFFGVDDVKVTLVPMIQNGGFETGDYSNWAKSGNTSGISIATGTNFARSGTNGAAFGAVGSPGYISQVLGTTPGQKYLVSFWLNRPTVNPGANEFLVSWNGSVLFDRTNTPTAGWTNLHFAVVASTTRSTLTFGGRDDPDFFALDEISITPIPLVVNGGFEMGDLSGWTQSGNTNPISVTTNSSFVSSGYYGLKAGPVGLLGHLSQNLDTLPGQDYLVSCWFSNPSGGTPNDLEILWNNNPLLNLTNWFSTGWFNPQFLVTASATNSTLDFGFDDTPGYFAIDEVTVQPFPGPKIQSAANHAGLLTFTWNSVPGFGYQVQYSTNLVDWNSLGPVTYPSGTAVTTSDNIGPDPNRFYRIMVQQPLFLF